MRGQGFGHFGQGGQYTGLGQFAFAAGGQDGCTGLFGGCGCGHDAYDALLFEGSVLAAGGTTVGTDEQVDGLAS